jgi:guanine deaminase
MAPLEKTLYIGPFIQSESLTELKFMVNGMVGVDEEGKISFIRKDHKGRQIPIDGEWEKAKVVFAGRNGFFFPGFIGSFGYAYPSHD